MSTRSLPVHFSRAVQFLATFNVCIEITLAYFLTKSIKLYFSQSPQKHLKTGQNSFSYDHPVRNNGPLEKLKNYVFENCKTSAH